MVGVVVGRWWALLAAVALGLWIASVVEVEVPAWFIGGGYGLISALGIAFGVMLRRHLGRPSST
jgi:hypothetical protein